MIHGHQVRLGWAEAGSESADGGDGWGLAKGTRAVDDTGPQPPGYKLTPAVRQDPRLVFNFHPVSQWLAHCSLPTRHQAEGSLLYSPRSAPRGDWPINELDRSAR